MCTTHTPQFTITPHIHDFALPASRSTLVLKTTGPKEHVKGTLAIDELEVSSAKTWGDWPDCCGGGVGEAVYPMGLPSRFTGPPRHTPWLVEGGSDATPRTAQHSPKATVGDGVNAATRGICGRVPRQSQ